MIDDLTEDTRDLALIDRMLLRYREAYREHAEARPDTSHEDLQKIAMRAAWAVAAEPTDAMLKAGWLYDQLGPEPANTWQAMHEAAGD